MEENERFANASDVFNIPESSADRITEKLTNVLTCRDEDLHTITDVIRWAGTMSGGERDFAMFAAGKLASLNDFRNDPKSLISMLL